MKNKPILILALVTLIAFLSSMTFISISSMQDVAKENAINISEEQKFAERPLYHKGVMCFKLKEGLGDFERMEGKINLQIPAIDKLLERYEVKLLTKRFKYNPNMLKMGMPDLSRIYTIEFPESYPVNKLVNEFKALKEIEYAEPISIIYKSEIPDDPLFTQQYHLPLTMAPEGWDIHKGENGAEVLIGIADDAIDWRHEDLVDNAWQNLGEDFDGDGHVIEFNGTDWIFDPDDENGIDDDGNGKVDDFVGWDFFNQDEEEDNDPTPELVAIDHGTHCIGCANSRTNNTTDCASIAWNVKFVGAKLSNQGGPYYNASAHNANIYLAELGADILTCSWTSGGGIAAQEAVEYCQSLGCLIVAAAGNDANEELNYPASYPGVVSVAATTQWDSKATFSSYGVAIDVCAPGVNIMSLKPFDNTQTMSGTSMACPVTAGLLALLKSYHPAWGNDQIIEQMLATADDIDSVNSSSLANKLGYGRINVFRALTEVDPITQQELRLQYISSSFADADTNGLIQPGELVSMDFDMRNFAIGVDSSIATFTLSSNSPYINMIEDQITLDVPNDNFFGADSAFLFELDAGLDSTKVISLILSANSYLPIPVANEWEIELIVNQQGILVYNGQGSGSAYSGSYIKNFFDNEGIPVFYTDIMPPGLVGFDVAFLSFGNYGQTLTNGTRFDVETTEIIADYLYQGGYLYVDCGSFFGLMVYDGFTNVDEMESLFGVDTVITPLTYNSIDSLGGFPNSLGENLVFYHSTQSPNYYIDIMEPDSSGIPMFEEDDYGIVAVQNVGAYGQRTVCFSYSIGHLQDDSLSTNELLLARIAEFFDLLNVDIAESPLSIDDINLEIFPNPVQNHCSLKIKSDKRFEADIMVYDISGRMLVQLQNRVFHPGSDMVKLNTSSLPDGLYIIHIMGDGYSASKKIIKR